MIIIAASEEQHTILSGIGYHIIAPTEVQDTTLSTGTGYHIIVVAEV